MRHAAIAGILLLGFGAAAASQPGTRTLTFESRVHAQEAIERVYYSHQIGATKPFGEAVPRAVIERKVVSYLKQSAALEKLWHTPVTAAMLERELSRMSRGSRMPERLRELYDALGNDRDAILECLARPALVGRLTRSFFDYDKSIHATALAEAETVRAELASGALDALLADPRRVAVDLTRNDTTGSPDRRVRSEQFDRWSEEFPRHPGQVGPVIERQDGFTVSTVLERTTNRLRAAVYRIPKRTREDWWASVERDLPLSPQLLQPKRAHRDSAAIEPSAPQACPTDDTWEPTLDDAPEWRTGHTAVWTGTEMIVWGGHKPFFALNQPGLRYDPATDTWAPIAASNAPDARYTHQVAVWTGSRMVVAGDTSGVYDPTSDSWSTVSSVNGPPEGDGPTVVAVGGAVIVWGGNGVATGKRYDWTTDTWTTISTLNAPSPRSGHSAVSTGSRMIVWGGGSDNSGSGLLNTGGIYDPAGDTWTVLSTVGAPIGRTGHTAVWAGNRMIVWGGVDSDGSLRNDGGRYDPVANSWASLSVAGAPSPRTSHTAVTGGARMLIWGGSDASAPILGTGGRYDPVADTWTSVSTVNAPSPRREQVAVWSGEHMVVWGGTTGGDRVLNTGGRYDPISDTWTPTSVGSTPIGRTIHTAVWTGSQMVVWGGYDQLDPGLELDSGGRYDPATDTWSPTSRLGAPIGRYSHTAVWSGNVMVVWGGYAGYPTAYTNTGSRYDPIADTWLPTSTADAPTGRYYHTAIWTGSSMVVWGGHDNSYAILNTGGRYDPVADTWTPTSTVGAPAARSTHAAVWTGSVMVVWGGGGAYPTVFDSGGRYNPLTDTWTPTSTVGAPSARSAATAVWTGSAMIVWGGLAGHYNAFDTGGRYDPITDTWNATSTTGAPVRRFEHTAVWTGHEMVVWGGVVNFDTLDNSGGRYKPSTDSWTTTSDVSVPSGRHQHTAVWTGSLMVVFGGSGNEGGREEFSSGGNYNVEYDADGDGYTVCQGDCDDTRASIHPGAAESCNGLDDNCNGQTDEDVVGVDTDGDGIHNACDNCRSAYNPDQLDSDGDHAGNACDNCLAIANPGQQDLDSDQRGDSCDNCPAAFNPFQDDSDGDRRGDACDNCLFDYNPSQSDFNQDGEGDICDLNDGLIYIYSTAKNYREWQPESGYTTWNSYRGSLAVLRTTVQYTQAPGSNALAVRQCGLIESYVIDNALLGPGEVAFILVTGVAGGVESGLGTNSAGVPRANANPCP